MEHKVIRTGEVWLVDLGNQKGSVQKGKRPAVVVSPDWIYEQCKHANIVPLTTQTKKRLPTHVKILQSEGLDEDSTALCEQSRSLTEESFIRKLTELSPKTMKEISNAYAIVFKRYI
jgi:mRNA interferase MazF